MRSFDYLIRRLHRSGLSVFMGCLVLAVIVPALFAPRLFYRPPYVTQKSSDGTARFEFQFGQPLWELAVKYRLADYTDDLNAYLSYIRREKSALSPRDPDRSRQAYLNFLTDQEVLHLYYLRETIGWAGQENYYFGRYAPVWVADMWEAVPRPKPIEEWNDPARWELVITAGLGSKDPYTAARAMNLNARLPLVQTGSSASGKVFEMTRQLRFLILLLPLAAFLALFQVKDRFLRREGIGLTVKKHLAVFGYSSAALIGLRLCAYLLLQLRYGDDEGAMHIMTPWALEDSGASGVMALRSYIALISLTDAAFLFFLAALVCFLERATRHPAVSALTAAGLFCLPWPAWFPAPLPSPMAYLRWQIEPAGFAAQLPPDSPSALWRTLWPSFHAPPGQMAFSLLLWGLILLGLAAAAHRQREELRRKLAEKTEITVHK